MSISSQLPPIPLAVAGASLRALAQAAGQTVEARILSQSSNGTSQVQIGRQVLTLTLPEGPPVGATLTLSVQQSEGQLRLGLVSVRLPGETPAAGTATGVTSSPATSVQLSAQALSGAGLPATTGTISSIVAAPQAQPNVSPPAAAVSSGTSLPTGDGPPNVARAVDGPAAGRPASVPQAIVASVGQGTPSVAAPGTAGPAVATPSGGAGATVDAGQGVSVGASSAATSPSVGPASSLPGATSAQPGAAQAAQSGAVRPQAQSPTPAPAPVSGQTVAPAAGVVTNQTAIASLASPQVRPNIPYAIAPSATVPTGGTATSAANALPPVGQAVLSSAVGQHAPAPNTLSPPSAAGSVAAASIAGASQPANPEVALAQMVQQALPRQDSIVGLTRTLASIAGKVALPEPVAKAAQLVLSARTPVDAARMDGAAIKAAVQRSGIFQESLLASGQGQAAAGDVKTALLGLRQSLVSWLGNQSAIAQVSSVAPPLRGQIPRARGGEAAPPDLPDDPVEIGKVLVERTDAALSRLRLHQHASLPDPAAPRQDAHWSLDLPVMVAGQQHLLNLQIQRDAEKEDVRPQDRGWQVRFAINLAGRGEVGAQVSLRTRTAGVMLWAEDPQTAEMLGEATDSLRDAIAEVGLTAGAIVVRMGAPSKPKPSVGGPATHFVDATR